MPNKYDIIIVGGGVIGCAIAYELAKRKVKTLVVEQRQLGSGASQAAAGMLAPLSDSTCHPALIDFAFESFALCKTYIPELEEASGVSTECMPSGILRCAFTEEEESHLKVQAALGMKRGLRVERLTQSQALKTEPLLSPNVRSAAFSVDEPQLSPTRLVDAYRRAALAHGADFREETAVTGLVKRGSKVVGVRAHHEILSAVAVVLATGSWGRAAGDWLGFDVPIAPVRGQMVYVNKLTRPLTHAVFHGESYAVPKSDSLTLVGTTLEHNAGFNQHVTVEGITSVLTRIQTVVPSIGAATMNHTRAGLRPQNANDDLPILGRAPGIDGVVLSMGHYRSGILLSALTGQMIADVLTTNKPKRPLGAFDAARLARK